MWRKPDRVFDRDSEWDALVRFATSASPDVRLGIVSGRRRQGKTFLLDAVTEAAGGMFYSATDTTEALALADFAAALADRTGGGRYAFANWDEALERLFALVTGGIIVIDEFPYLSRSTPALPSLIQRALGPRGYAQAGQARLLLCGSAVSVMGQLLGGTAPLRGRASLELIVRPLGYRAAARFWNVGDDPRLAVLLNSVVGGTPAYRREFVAGDAPENLSDFDNWVLRTVLSPEVPLFREARYMLAEDNEIRDTAIYHAVLAAIAEGNNTRGGVASCIGRKSPDIGHPLAVLEDSQLIAREADPFRKGRSYYRICEPLIVFYEAVMRRAWTRLERGDKAAVWHNAQSAFFSQVVGPHFESICRQWAASPEAAQVFGEWAADVAATLVADPVRHDQIQVDVAALAAEERGRPRRILSLGEVKWGKTMTMRHFDRLRRARDLLSVRGYDTTGTKLACYSAAGFDADLRSAAAHQPDALLIGLSDLYS
jgi:uncharacterized protein